MRLAEKVIQSHHRSSQAGPQSDTRPQRIGLIKAPVSEETRQARSRIGAWSHVLALELPQLSKSKHWPIWTTTDLMSRPRSRRVNTTRT